jgi:hypothetical protein
MERNIIFILQDNKFSFIYESEKKVVILQHRLYYLLHLLCILFTIIDWTLVEVKTNKFFTCLRYKCQIEQTLDIQLNNNLHSLSNIDVVGE